jgi:hypothetical protein
MIEVLEGFPGNVIAIAGRGRITKADYENVLVPAVEQALKQYDKIRIYYEIGTDFQGIDPGAAWEDLKVGMEHLSRWDRAAVVTDVEWIGTTMKVFGFMLPIEIKLFPLSQVAEARGWILA